ncbi:MAG: DUF4845 domain-containing protein [Pseudomonadota bacterium]
MYHTHQKGGSFIGMVIVIAAVVFFAMLGLKLGPAYLEFMNVKNAIKKVANSTDLSDRKAVITQFNNSATVDNISVVKGSDLLVKDGVVSVEYQVVVPIMANASALLDFNATATK